MLKSILEGAKATLNRTGEWDYMPQQGTYQVNRQGEPAESHEDEEAHPSAVIEGEANCTSISARFLVSRSFSQLGALTASGASAVNKAIMPLTRALKGDPETKFARDSLAKYCNQLSSAVSEAYAATARREEERDLLVEALEAQENNLRCWGYLSVLPSFREHRRRETARAEILVNLAVVQGAILATRLEEVDWLLESMPVLWHWSKPSAGTAGPKHGRGSPGGAQERNGDGQPLGGVRAPKAERDGERIGRGACGDRAFEEEAIIVPPSDLLASDRGFELRRRQLRACDEACAAAADAFARKVVDAGGLEPRSHEERSQILLALLSRYDVLARTIGAGMAPKRAATRSSVPLRPATHAGPPGVGDARVSSKIPRDKGVETGPGVRLGTWDSTREGGNGGNNHADDERERCHEEAAGDGRQGDRSSGANPLTTMSSCPCPSALASPNQDVEASQRLSPDDSKDFAAKSEAVDALGGDVVASREREEDEQEEDGETEMLREGRKACEDAFLELLSDERTREGRLLRRFLVMALAAASDRDRPLSAPSRNSGKRTAPAKVGAKAAGSDTGGKANKEGNGAVGPKVVKAFINYFSKEYLKERFDVPVMLLPALSELVASLVFRQARALVLGYNGSRVKKGDRVWREKVGKMRSLSLAQLGVPLEYVPTRAKHIDGAYFQGGTSYFLGVAASTDLTVTEGKHARCFDGASGQTESGVTLEEAVAIVGGIPDSLRRGGANLRASRADGSASEGGNVGAFLEQKQEQQEQQEQQRRQQQGSKKVDMRVGSHPRAEESVLLVGGGAAVFTGGVRVEGPEGIAVELGPLGAKESGSESVETARTGFVERQIAAGSRGTSLIIPKIGGCSVRDRPSAAPGVGARAARGGSELDDSKPLDFQVMNARGATQGEIVLMHEERDVENVSEPLAGTPVLDRGASTTTRVPGTGEARGLAEYGGACEAETETASVTKTPEGVRGRLNEFRDEPAREELENGEERLSLSTRTTSSLMTPSPKAGLEMMPRPYYSASREFSRIGDCITPVDILAVVKEGMASLAREAVQVSVRGKALDADSLLPLLVYTLVHANVPRIHEAMNFVRNFGGTSGGGELAYYLTSMEAAVSFVLDWSSDDDSTRSTEESTAPCCPRPKSDKMVVSMSAVANGGPGMTMCDESEGGGDRSESGGQSASAGAESNRNSEQEEGLEELKRLGIFLENHEVQEKTVDGLSSVGWI